MKGRLIVSLLRGRLTDLLLGRRCGYLLVFIVGELVGRVESVLLLLASFGVSFTKRVAKAA